MPSGFASRIRRLERLVPSRLEHTLIIVHAPTGHPDTSGGNGRGERHVEEAIAELHRRAQRVPPRNYIVDVVVDADDHVVISVEPDLGPALACWCGATHTRHGMPTAHLG
jgi:hypothetical protein